MRPGQQASTCIPAITGYELLLPLLYKLQALYCLLLQVLVERVGGRGGSGEGGTQKSSRVMQLVILLAVVVYVYVLGGILVSVAREGTPTAQCAAHTHITVHYTVVSRNSILFYNKCSLEMIRSSFSVLNWHHKASFDN